MVKLNLTTKEMEELLEQYYLESEGVEAKVHFYAETTYHGIYEDKIIEPRARVTRMINILGKQRSIEEVKYKDDIKKCLNECLNREGYSLENIVVHSDTDRGITSNSVEISVRQSSKNKVKVYENSSEKRIV